MKPKKELVRVVRAPVKEDENGVQTGGEVSLDLTGRKPGRGAYVCRDPECLKRRGVLNARFPAKLKTPCMTPCIRSCVQM